MLASLLLAFALAQSPQADSSAALAELLSRARQARHFPGAAARVSRNGETLAVAAIGVRRRGKPEAIAPGDRFHLGSVTKPMTAALIAGLVEDGTLRWDETLEEMFPGRPVHRALRAVTLLQLLTHRAGLQGFRDQGEFEEAPRLYGDATSQRSQFAGWLLARKPAIEPGSAFLYSNAGIAVAAAAAERATGRPYEELMRTRLFEPLGMRSAGFGWPASQDDHQPFGHRVIGGDVVVHDPHDAYQLNAVLAPGADAHMSVGDLGRFLDDQARGLAGAPALLEPGTYRRLHSQGIGWVVSNAGGRTVSQQFGSAETFYAVAAVAHDDGLTVALVLNDGDAAAAAELARAIWARFREAGPRPGGG